MNIDATSLSIEKERRRSRSATPAELAKLVVDLVKPQPGEKLLDPACGAGEMLAAAGRNYPGVKLYGWDKDADALAECEKNLREGGVEATLEKHDVLNESSKKKGSAEIFDVFVCEPFFGAVKDRKRPSRSEVEFLEYMLARMNDSHGRLAILVPGSFMLGGMDCVRRVWKKMTDENLVDAIIKLPPNVLYGLAIAPNLLILKKNRATDKVCFIDVSGEAFYDRRVALTVLKKDVCEKIVETYRAYPSDVMCDPTFAQVRPLSFKEGIEKDFELEDPFLVEENARPKNLRKIIPALESDICQIQNLLKELDRSIQEMMKK